MTTLAPIEVRAGALVLTVGGGSDIGRRYPANFDVVYVEAPASGAASLLAVVTDGMGADIARSPLWWSTAGPVGSCRSATRGPTAGGADCWSC